MSKARKQSSTSYPINFLMVDSADHVTGKTGLTVTVTLSKSGAAFGAASGAVTEIANGWYSLAGNATDRNTLGELLIHATSTGADPTDERYEIVAHDPFALGNEMADALLNRDMSAVSDSNSRSPLNALRFIRNKWTLTGATLSVKKEDDSTESWSATVSTDAAAVPIVGSDPA